MSDVAFAFVNLAERAIRSFALGRRNWPFVQTTRANDLEPYAYLRRPFAELSRARTIEDFEALLPFSSLSGKENL